MTPDRWDAWKPQEPPEDFARRTVAAVLHDGRVGRRVSGARWVVVAAAVATLVGGVAWGFSARSGGRAPRMSPAATPAASEVRSMEPIFAPAVAPPDAGSRAHDPVQTTAGSRRSHGPAPEKSPPDAGRKVIVPTCDCDPDQVMCTCF